MLQPFASTASTSTGGRLNKNPAFNDGQVRGYISKLKERINNLADKGNKSLITSDALEYCIKPACRAGLTTNPALSQLFAGGPQRNGVQYGHPFYSWFMHAAASECVSMWIQGNIDDIFGKTGPLRQKYEAGVAKVRQNGGNVVNYLKRTFSRPIKTAYVSIRKDMITDTWRKSSTSVLGLESIQGLLNLALAAKRANAKSVAAFRRAQTGGFGGMTGGFAPSMPSFTTATPTLTPSAPSTSSASSSSSSMHPQPFGMSQLTGNQ